MQKDTHTLTSPIKVKSSQKSIVNRLTCATLEGVSAKVIEIEATFIKKSL